MTKEAKQHGKQHIQTRPKRKRASRSKESSHIGSSNEPDVEGDCGTCLACTTVEDCRECTYCEMNDATNSVKQKCLQRFCHTVYPYLSNLKQPSNKKRARRPSGRRCGRCLACCRIEDCGSCTNCMSKGGFKMSCLLRKCVRPPAAQIPTTAQSPAPAAAVLPKKRGRPKGSTRSKDFHRNSTGTTGLSSQATAPPSGLTGKPRALPPTTTTLTSYLDELETTGSVNETPSASRTELYGIPIPSEAPENTCSGCLGVRDVELEDGAVLLCDGKNCNREYHLACCYPPLTAVPKHDWYCQDCSPDGAVSSSLVEYFEQAHKTKAAFFRETDAPNPQKAFFQSLLLRDCKEANLPTNRFPVSELERSAMIQSLALCDCSTQLARTRGGSEQHEQLTPADYLGKPIRMYNTIADWCHTGRIVDYRPVLEDATGEKGLSTDNTEFLIRFVAGKEGRKTAHQQWIILEEHAMAVGVSVVWLHNCKPAMLWVRSARELLPVQHLLKEKDAEIFFRDAFGNPVRARDDKPSTKSHRISALVNPFGEESFLLINVRDQSVDLLNELATEQLKDHDNEVQYHLAKVELMEQDNVRHWRTLPQINPVGPFCLTSRDSYSLPPLIPIGQEYLSEKLHTQLCPTVPHGLDRLKILKLLELRGVKPSKDIASSLVCQQVPVNKPTKQAEENGWKRQRA